jgi:hypothetical protein
MDEGMDQADAVRLVLNERPAEPGDEDVRIWVIDPGYDRYGVPTGHYTQMMLVKP